MLRNTEPSLYACITRRNVRIRKGSTNINACTSIDISHPQGSSLEAPGVIGGVQAAGGSSKHRRGKKDQVSKSSLIVIVAIAALRLPRASHGSGFVSPAFLREHRF